MNPASTVHTKNTDTTASRPPTPDNTIQGLSSAETTAKTPSEPADSADGAPSSLSSSLSGSRRWAQARLIRLSSPLDSVPSGCDMRSSTTATRKKARPLAAPFDTLCSWMALRRSWPRPPAPMMAAIPSIEMAKSSVWLMPVMMAGRARGT